MMAMELAICWYWHEEKLVKIFEITGKEHIDNALQRGSGIILLSAHFTSLEIGGRFLGMHVPFNAVYREHKTPFFEDFVKTKRSRYSESTIKKTNVRGMIRTLKKNKIIWYAPDQNFKGMNAVLANFYNIPTRSNTATARLAKVTNAAVIPFVQKRKKDSSGYELIIMPEMINFPSGNEVNDALQINQLFEGLINQQVADYYWVHRKFKGSPEPYDNLYAEL